MPEWMMQVVAAIATGCGIYAGIKADLARIHERVAQASKAAEKAHERIDNLMAQK